MQTLFNRRVSLMLCLVASAGPVCRGVDAATSLCASLAGEWRFALDREDAGVSQQWFTRNLMIFRDDLERPANRVSQGNKPLTSLTPDN